METSWPSRRSSRCGLKAARMLAALGFRRMMWPPLRRCLAGSRHAAGGIEKRPWQRLPLRVPRASRSSDHDHSRDRECAWVARGPRGGASPRLPGGQTLPENQGPSGGGSHPRNIEYANSADEAPSSGCPPCSRTDWNSAARAARLQTLTFQVFTHQRLPVPKRAKTSVSSERSKGSETSRSANPSSSNSLLREQLVCDISL
jgi:hypothetical protein